MNLLIVLALVAAFALGIAVVVAIALTARLALARARRDDVAVDPGSLVGSWDDARRSPSTPKPVAGLAALPPFDLAGGSASH